MHHFAVLKIFWSLKFEDLIASIIPKLTTLSQGSIKSILTRPCVANIIGSSILNMWPALINLWRIIAFNLVLQLAVKHSEAE